MERKVFTILSKTFKQMLASLYNTYSVMSKHLKLRKEVLSLTKNQIEFNKLRETQRANRASEDLTRKRDIASRDLGLSQLQETARHNMQVELNARDNLAEQFRHNTAQLEEQHRNNLAREGILRLQADTGVEQQQEAARHNAASEDLQDRNLALSQYVADVGASSRLETANIGAAASQAAAAISAAASNYASDNALLARQIQADIDLYGINTNKGLKTAENMIKKWEISGRIGEQVRSDQANESMRQAELDEKKRHALVQEALDLSRMQHDVALRQTQNSIAQQQVDLRKREVDVNIPLTQSQTLSNYAHVVKDTISSATSAAGVLAGLGGKP